MSVCRNQAKGTNSTLSQCQGDHKGTDTNHDHIIRVQVEEESQNQGWVWH